MPSALMLWPCGNAHLAFGTPHNRPHSPTCKAEPQKRPPVDYFKPQARRRPNTTENEWPTTAELARAAA